MDQSNNLDEYRLTFDVCHAELGRTCLTYLTLQDFDIQSSLDVDARSARLEKYSFRSYAAAQWPLHINSCPLEDQLCTLCKKLLNPSKPHIFMTWAQDYHSYINQYYGFTDETHISFISAATKVIPLRYAAMLSLPEVCAWHSASECDPNHMSALGTPLHCALIGNQVICHDGVRVHGWRKYEDKWAVRSKFSSKQVLTHIFLMDPRVTA